MTYRMRFVFNCMVVVVALAIIGYGGLLIRNARGETLSNYAEAHVQCYQNNHLKTLEGRVGQPIVWDGHVENIHPSGTMFNLKPYNMAWSKSPKVLCKVDDSVEFPGWLRRFARVRITGKIVSIYPSGPMVEIETVTLLNQ